MKLDVLGCCGGAAPGQSPTSYVVNGRIAIDAGNIASRLSLDAQSRVRHLLLTHAHLDHLRELVLFLDNTFGRTPEPVVIHGLPPVLDALRAHCFNGHLWPDLLSLDPPPARLEEVLPGASKVLEGLEITPVPSFHGVPATGYLLRDGGGADPDASGSPPPPTVVVATDTGYEPAYFEGLASRDRLDVLLIETSFPERLADLANRSYHLTPGLLESGLRVVLDRHPDLRVYVTHLKPPYRDEIRAELAKSKLPLEVLEDGQTLRI